MAIVREERTAAEIKEWMDNQLHKDGEFEEYQFNKPARTPDPPIDACNWSLSSYPLRRSTNDPVERPLGKDVLRAVNRITAEAQYKFNLKVEGDPED